MQYKEKPNAQPGPRRRPRPGQDIIRPRRAPDNSFPMVGTTLPSYNRESPTNPLSYREVPKVPARLGRLRRLWSGITIKRVILTLVALLFIIGAWVGGKFIYDTHKLFGGSIFGILSSSTLKGQASGRVNILLAGNSADDPGHDGADLTDSIMLISINTKNDKAFLLSIPRDLWVDIPGNGYQKINDAYVVGQEDSFSAPGYPSGGMGQLEQIVSDKFGIPIDYYALINYQALRQAVDAVGGITVNIQSSDPRGLYDPSIDYSTRGPLVKLTNGEHTLDGEQALDLARARGDAYGSYGFPDSDFDRTQNQRLMLVALKSKAETAGVLANPAKLTSLFDAIGNNVKTDLTLGDVHTMYNLTKTSTMSSLSLNNDKGTNLLANFTSLNGESALVPAAGTNDYSQIDYYMQQITSSNPVVQEGANVVVLNATDTSGLASGERTKLTAKGMDVTAIGNALANQTTTTVIDNSNGKLVATRQLLGQLFNNHFTTVNPYANAYKADFIVVLGSASIANTTNTQSTSQ